MSIANNTAKLQALLAQAQALPEAGTTPTGTIAITENGTHDVTQYASAEVNVPIPEGYIQPEGTKTITANGTHDVTQCASAEVNVPIPEGYIQPEGAMEITENGEHDVTQYASVNVNVEQSGGGGVDTCSISVNTRYGPISVVARALVFEDGKMKFKKWASAYGAEEMVTAPFVMKNVVCGSLVGIATNIYLDPQLEYDGDILLFNEKLSDITGNDSDITSSLKNVGTQLLRSPLTNGASASLTFIEND